MLKKLAIALTAITFTLALTGCGGEKKTAEAMRRRKEDRRGKRCETGCHGRSCELFQTGSQ